MEKKRERAVNFTTAETQLLISLVSKYKNIIENKKTDAVTNKDKDAAWSKIEKTFNATGVCTVLRTARMLKQKYETIKKLTKKKSAVKRQEMYRTAGGPSSAPDFDEVEEKVMSICKNITGLDSRYDSDNIINIDSQTDEISKMEDCLLIISVDENEKENLDPKMQPPEIVECQESKLAEPEILECPENECAEPEILEFPEQSTAKWESWNPKALEQKVSSVLKTSKAGVTAKLDKLSSERLELVSLQKELAMEELKFKRQEHELKMEHMKNEEKRLQEIHELTIAKLQNYK